MMELVYEPLSKENIEECIALLHSVFPEDALSKDNPGKALRASVYQEDNKEFWEKYHCKTLEYLLVRDTASHLVGMTGFYTNTNEPDDVVWLGWFFVAPEYRGKGLGRKILEWSISEARSRGYRLFRLYTSDDPNEAAAQPLYEKLGFKKYKEMHNSPDDPESPYKTIYRELTL